MSFPKNKLSANFRNLFAIFFISFCAENVIAQTKFEPLEDYLSARPKWTEDNSEVIYVGLRCASLYWQIGAYFDNYGNGTEHTKTVEMMRERGQSNFIVAVFFGLAESGGNTPVEVFRIRSRNLSNIYAGDIEYNKSVNNNVFSGYIKRDFDVCNQRLDDVQRTEKLILKSKK